MDNQSLISTKDAMGPVYLDEPIKECPTCQEKIAARAEVCPVCSAEFEIYTRAYCTQCHRLIHLTTTGKCPICMGEALLDPRDYSLMMAAGTWPGSEKKEPENPSNERPVSTPGEIKACPLCGRAIQAEAPTCSFCGARFDVSITGYCPHCHNIMRLNEAGRCSKCGGEIVDRQVTSSLAGAAELQPAATQAAPIPVTVTPEPPQEAQIHCHKCKVVNASTESVCRQCGANLLPGTSFGERALSLGLGLVFAVVLGVVSITLFANTQASPWWSLCLGVLALSTFAAGFQTAFARNPTHKRYYQRAQRHLKLNTRQAMADLSNAIDCAPSNDKMKYIQELKKLQAEMGTAEEAATDLSALIQKCSEALTATESHRQKAELLEQRAEFHAQLGAEEQKVRDLLEATYEIEKAIKKHEYKMNKDGENLAQFFTGYGDALASGYALGQEKDARKKVEKQRMSMLMEGKIRAIGYCKKCKDAVPLNNDLTCSRCGKAFKHPQTLFAVPADLEKAVVCVRQKRGVS